MGNYLSEGVGNYVSVRPLQVGNYMSADRRSRRTVPIPPALARELAAHIAARRLRPDDRVFADPNGGLLRHERFYRCHWRPARKALGLPALRFHDLRHTYASLMHAQGRSMLEVSRWMGHSTYQLTADTYSHLWDGEDETLSGALDAAYLGADPTSNVVPLRTA
jgi:integrase